MPIRLFVLLLFSGSMALAAPQSQATQSADQSQAQPANIKDQIIMGACSQAMASELSLAGKPLRLAWSRRPAVVWSPSSITTAAWIRPR